MNFVDELVKAFRIYIGLDQHKYCWYADKWSDRMGSHIFNSVGKELKYINNLNAQNIIM